MEDEAHFAKVKSFRRLVLATASIFALSGIFWVIAGSLAIRWDTGVCYIPREGRALILLLGPSLEAMAIVAIVFGEFPKIQHSDAGAIFVIRFISDVYKVFYLDALKIRNDHALEFVLVILLALACQLAFLSLSLIHI